MDIVFAHTTSFVNLNGARVVVRKGQHWPADDPVVRAQPSLFSPDPRYGLTYSAAPDGFDAPPLEAASSVPGEKRTVRR